MKKMNFEVGDFIEYHDSVVQILHFPTEEEKDKYCLTFLCKESVLVSDMDGEMHSWNLSSVGIKKVKKDVTNLPNFKMPKEGDKVLFLKWDGTSIEKEFGCFVRYNGSMVWRTVSDRLLTKI